VIDTVTRRCFLNLRCFLGPVTLCYLLDNSSCNSAILSDREYLAQIEKIANSSLLHGSESLCKLLRYLARNAVDHPGAHPKEYQIATEVFGRSADFDPQIDSTVRVQVGRLRQKLHEYYSSEGVDDSILVDLPKGSYALGLHHRDPNPVRKDSNPVRKQVELPVAAERSAPPVPRKWAIAVTALSLLLAGAVAVIVAQRMTGSKPAEAAENYSPPALRLFWKPYLSGPEEPWVVFSNASFVGRPETGMRYLDPARDVQPKILDHYTGVGEVLAVHELDHVFATLHRQLRVKRGSLLSLDDVKNNDLIFVGSPAENLTLRDIPGTREFVFRRLTDGPREGDLAIVSLHPESGEPKEFLGTPNDLQLTDDYSVIALVKGLNPARSVLILAGTTTLGTQAAVEYVCRQNFVEQLLLRLSVAPTGEVEPFEAVLHVKVTRGVPMESEIVALRKAVSQQ
jgi:hypothetical protein